MTQGKRPRATVAQKVQILDFLHQNKCLQADVVERFQNTVAISKTTINEWLRNERQFRQRLAEGGADNRRRGTFKYEQINLKMDEFVKNSPSASEPELRAHWRHLAQHYGVDDPKRLDGFSHGWLEAFKKRHKMVKRRKKDANGDADPGEEFPQKSLGFDAFPEPYFERLPYDDRAGLRINSLLAPSLSLDPQIRRQSESHVERRKQSESHGDRRKLRALDHRAPTQAQTLDQSLGGLQTVDKIRHKSLHSQNQSPQFKYPKDIGSEVLVEPPPGSTVSAQEIERFFFFRANQFFARHQYDYPQTHKLYEEFKTSFLSERLILMRADPGIPVPEPPKHDYGLDIVPDFGRKRPKRKLAPKTLWEQNKNSFT